MIQPELLGRLRLLAEAYRLPLPAINERVNEPLPAGAVRQVVPAEVEARLSDGRYRVIAAGQRFDVTIPESAKAGDRIQIALPLALRPGEAAAGTGAGALARSVPPNADGANEAVDARFSSAGRFVAQLAQQQPEGAQSGRVPASISAVQALLPDAPVNPQVAAATLRELIALSGLFYESHQAEWVSGQRAAHELQREPQGKLPPLPSQPEQLRPPPSLPATESASTTAGNPSTGAPAAPPIRPETAPLIQQQLNTLEARHIVWQGQIWTGQPMRWEIEELERREPGAQESGRPWQTRIELRLPNLGFASALLTLDGAGSLAVRLRAESERTEALFGERLAELRTSLTAAGIPVSGILRDTRARAG